MQREQRPGLMAASAMFATGALAALALTLTFALEKGWLTVALALMAPGAAWIAGERPLPWLRWLAAIMVSVVVARIAYEPRIVGDDIGTTPIFNWLLYGYGIPAASFWLGGWLLRKRADDLPAHIVDAGAILFTVLLAVLEIRHYVTGGDMYRPMSGTTEIMLYANVGLAMTIGLEHIRVRTGSIVHNAGALIVAALTLVAVLADLIAASSLQFGNTPLAGGAFFNQILLGCGLPAVLAITLALIARTTRPMSYRVVAAIAAVTLALFYLTLEVRRLFQGPILAGAHQRRRAIHLFDGVARLRHRAARGWLRAALATGAVARARRHHTDHRQGVSVRYRQHRRHLSRAVGDRARRRAARHRLAVSARALSADGGARARRRNPDLRSRA